MARKTAPKKFEPIKITSKPVDEPELMLDLFEIDGVTYQISGTPRMELALQLLEDIELYGEALANMKHLRKLLGDTAWDALRDHKNLRPEDLVAVSNAATNFSLGALEEASGN